jgi:hypothetical protein
MLDATRRPEAAREAVRVHDANQEGPRVFRRIMPALAAATLLLAACGGSGPAIDDPREIVTQGMEATTGLNSAHLALTVDGTVTMAELGSGQITLTGTTVEGDVDLENTTAHLTFAVPSLLGLSGEVIMLGNDTYLKTSMTGDTWAHSTSSTGDPTADLTDPTKLLDDVRAFLDKEGVEAEKLSDTDCGDSKCYAVRLTIPASLLADTGAAAGISPGDLVGDALVLDLLFERNDLWLAGVSTELGSESVGQLTLSLTLSSFNEDVSVEAPPADQVTEGGSGLPF